MTFRSGSPRVLIAALLLALAALPVFSAGAARRAETGDRRPPIAQFYAEKVQVEQEAKEIFLETMQAMVSFNDDFEAAKPVLQAAVARLDGLRERLLETARRLDGQFPAEGLQAGLESIRSRQRHLASYAMGRTADSEVRRLLGDARVDEIFADPVEPRPAGFRRPKPTAAVLKPFRRSE